MPWKYFPEKNHPVVEVLLINNHNDALTTLIATTS